MQNSMRDYLTKAKTRSKNNLHRLKYHLRRHKRFYIALAVVLVFVLILFIAFVVRPAFALKRDIDVAQANLKATQKALRQKDFGLLQAGFDTAKNDLDQIKKDYSRFGYLNSIPFLKGYYQDGMQIFEIADRGITIGEILLDAIEPYKELVGFGGSDEEKTTEQQILQIAQISPQLIPALDGVKQELAATEEILKTIAIDRYPESFRGIAIHDTYELALEQIRFAQTFITDVQPILPEIPTALGEPDPKTYLLLFQNDKELRPTGGFITFYAFVRFEKGVFSIIDSGNIYSIDPELNILPIPPQLVAYMKVTKYFMRDTNFSPDLVESLEDFETLYQYTGLPAYDGIFTIDTHFVEQILTLTGPVNMSRYNLDFSAYTHLPESCQTGGSDFTSENVVCRLELYAQKLLGRTDQRKQIIGDLMKEIVDKVLKLKAAQLPELLTVIFSELNQKHILLNFDNQILQEFVEKEGWGGRIEAVADGVDYLHVNDANLAGLKSDLYLKRVVDQKITVGDDGTVEKTLILTYENPEPQDGWLNAVARNYMRVYVPLGSELISVEGDVTVQTNVFEDLGKTVFDNFILIPPLEKKVVTITYRLPFKITDTYQLLIQKQPGKDRIPHTIDINGQMEEFDLLTDFDFTQAL